MKFFFFLVIVLHGVIHLLGFVKAYHLAEVRQLTQNISRRAGILWLVAALLLITAGVLYFLNQDYWWVIGAPAIFISQTLIFVSWKDAKFGTLATLIILLPLVISIANALPGSFRDIFRAEARQGINRLRAVPLVTDNDIQHLPLPVQKYLRYAGAVGKPGIQNFHATYRGQIRRTMQGGWMDFTSEQYNFVDDPTRIFFIESTMFGIPFDGLHLYVDASARMQIKIASLFLIVDAKGPTMTQGETVTLFNDMCVMAPASLIDTSIRWKSIDSLTAQATYAKRGYTVTATLSFNEEGALTDFTSNDRYLSEDGVTYKNYAWSTPLKEYVDIGGRKIASYGEAVWQTPEGEFVYGKFHLSSIEYNCTKLP